MHAPLPSSPSLSGRTPQSLFSHFAGTTYQRGGWQGYVSVCCMHMPCEVCVRACGWADTPQSREDECDTKEVSDTQRGKYSTATHRRRSPPEKGEKFMASSALQASFYQAPKSRTVTLPSLTLITKVGATGTIWYLRFFGVGTSIRSLLCNSISIMDCCFRLWYQNKTAHQVCGLRRAQRCGFTEEHRMGPGVWWLSD
jgi:hypothetical protein